MRFVAIPIAAIALILGVHYYLANRPVSYTTATVTRGPIVQESYATGNVESPTTASLHFGSGGKLVSLSARVGKQVQTGAILAKQDTAVLEAQLAQALSQVAAQQAQLQTILDGTRPEQIAVTEAQVAADEVTLSRTQASEADAIRSAFTAADSVLQNTLDPLFSSSHSSNPKLLFFVNDSTLQNAIEAARVTLGASIGTFGTQVSAMNDPAALEAASTQMLSDTASLLAQVNTALSQSTPNAQASATQLSAWSAAVGTARSTITSTTALLSAAITAHQSAAATLAKDQKTLALQQAGATQSSIDAQRAAVAAAQAQVSAIRAQIRNLEIIAPFAGTVTDTNGTVGENITPDVTVVALQPYQELDIKLNVSEDSIVGVKTGDRARIELDAFGSKDFGGTVRSVNPAQTIEGGAVYYETHVGFDSLDSAIKPGMTANVWIQTASSSDAVRVPASAITRSGTTSSVRVLVSGTPQTRTVETGITDQQGTVQIVSGLSEGDEVVIGN